MRGSLSYSEACWDPFCISSVSSWWLTLEEVLLLEQITFCSHLQDFHVTTTTTTNLPVWSRQKQLLLNNKSHASLILFKEPLLQKSCRVKLWGLWLVTLRCLWMEQHAASWKPVWLVADSSSALLVYLWSAGGSRLAPATLYHNFDLLLASSAQSPFL